MRRLRGSRKVIHGLRSVGCENQSVCKNPVKCPSSSDHFSVAEDMTGHSCRTTTAGTNNRNGIAAPTTGFPVEEGDETHCRPPENQSEPGTLSAIHQLPGLTQGGGSKHEIQSRSSNNLGFFQHFEISSNNPFLPRNVLPLKLASPESRDSEGHSASFTTASTASSSNNSCESSSDTLQLQFLLPRRDGRSLNDQVLPGCRNSPPPDFLDRLRRNRRYRYLRRLNVTRPWWQEVSISRRLDSPLNKSCEAATSSSSLSSSSQGSGTPAPCFGAIAGQLFSSTLNDSAERGGSAPASRAASYLAEAVAQSSLPHSLQWPACGELLQNYWGFWPPQGSQLLEAWTSSASLSSATTVPDVTCELPAPSAGCSSCCRSSSRSSSSSSSSKSEGHDCCLGWCECCVGDEYGDGLTPSCRFAGKNEDKLLARSDRALSPLERVRLQKQARRVKVALRLVLLAHQAAAIGTRDDDSRQRKLAVSNRFT